MTETEIKKGLAGVVVDYTAISKVNPETNSLLYRGYPVQELAATQPFEAVAYLLWNGELPTQAQLAEYTAHERSHRALDAQVKDALDALPVDCHPMDSVRTAVSILGAAHPQAEDSSPEAELEKARTLFAQLPAVVAYEQRRRTAGGPTEPIEPREDLDYSQNFLWMTFGEEAAPEVVDAFRVSMVLYAEHSFNASTFTARVITSTKSDVYSAITGAIGALKGPLHGGANEFVMHTMLAIDDPNKAADWINNALDNKNVVMGFGHRVYKRGDSRVPSMEKSFRELAARHDGEKWVAMYENMRDAMDARTGIKPNLDFPAGPAYHLLGFPVDFFTPLFVIARVAGWTAHIVEQYENNSLIRPLSEYNGEEQREVAPIEKR